MRVAGLLALVAAVAHGANDAASPFPNKYLDNLDDEDDVFQNTKLVPALLPRARETPDAFFFFHRKLTPHCWAAPARRCVCRPAVKGAAGAPARPQRHCSPPPPWPSRLWRGASCSSAFRTRLH